MLDEVIPKGYQPDGVYTKKVLFNNMVRLAKEDPTTYTKTITQVKHLGDTFATHMGISVGLDDIQPEYAQRNAILKPALAQIKKAKTKEDRQQIILKAQDKLIDQAITHPGTLGDMARSGARGTSLQLMRSVWAPVASNDERDNVQDWMTTHSYAEGLRPSEWWATNREARMAEVKSRLEVTEPGDLSKILINNTNDEIITTPDCSTHNGILLPLTDAHIIDRFTARTEGSLPRNTLVNARVLALLKKNKITQIMVRSPMTCEAPQGICQKCAGLNTTGHAHSIGDNLGIKASQSLGEPLMQLALNARHGVRASGADPMGISGLEGFRLLLESPETFRNKATLAPESGIITSIVKAPQGGHYISVNTTRAYVMEGLKPKVAVNSHVNKGDILSEGVPRPAEVVELKGLGAGREYLVDKLHGIYRDSNIDVDRRHFEVLAKSLLNHVQIDDVDDDASAEHGLVRGDIIDYNRYRNIASDHVKHTALDSAEGHYLGGGVLHHLVGTQITAPMVAEFKEAGLTKVPTSIKAPLISPITAPATRNPLLNPDWLVRLGHRYLKQSILEGAQKGQTTNLHGTSPLPGLVYSAEFGEGAEGLY